MIPNLMCNTRIVLTTAVEMDYDTGDKTVSDRSLSQCLLVFEIRNKNCYARFWSYS